MVNNSELFSLFGGGTDDGSLAGYSSVAGYWASITMVFGSLVAGATSVGGGAVAFPVMTLVLGITPPVARDFSMMIQTVGMVAATFTILYQQVRAPLSLPRQLPPLRPLRLGRSAQIVVDWQAIVWCTLGGVLGCPLSLALISPHLPPPVVKMVFVSTWFAFAMALYLLNRDPDRTTFKIIHARNFSRRGSAILVLVGVLGGILTGLSGSGMDITVL